MALSEAPKKKKNVINNKTNITFFDCRSVSISPAIQSIYIAKQPQICQQKNYKSHITCSHTPVPVYPLIAHTQMKAHHALILGLFIHLTHTHTSGLNLVGLSPVTFLSIYPVQSFLVGMLVLFLCLDCQLPSPTICLFRLRLWISGSEIKLFEPVNCPTQLYWKRFVTRSFANQSSIRTSACYSVGKHCVAKLSSVYNNHLIHVIIQQQ